MFLDLLSQIGLLQHNPATNILAALPLAPKAELLTTIFAELLENRANTPVLISVQSHLNFFYELVGAAFSLPLSHGKLTQKALEIYILWFNDPEVCPPPVAQNLNDYITVCSRRVTFRNDTAVSGTAPGEHD